MVKELLQALIFVLLAIPFVYMAYDVSKQLSVQTIKIVNEKAWFRKKRQSEI